MAMAKRATVAVCFVAAIASARAARAETPDARLDAALASGAASERERDRALGWTGVGVLGATTGAGVFEAARAHDVVWLVPSLSFGSFYAWRTVAAVVGVTPYDELARYRRTHTYDETLAEWQRRARDERAERRGIGALSLVLGAIEIGGGAAFYLEADARPITNNRELIVGTTLALTGVAMVIDGVLSYVVEGALERRLRAF